jgi:hypothetical protein
MYNISSTGSWQNNPSPIELLFAHLSKNQLVWKTIWRLLKNLNIDLPYDPSIPFLVIYAKECDSGYSKGTCTPMFIAVLFTIAKFWK